MSLQTYLHRLRFVDSLIRRKATGDSQTLAKKLDLSRSQTLSFLKEMKDAGFPIKYSRHRKSYYYSITGKLVNELFQEDMTVDEMRKINGGQFFFKNLQSPIISD